MGMNLYDTARGEVVPFQPGPKVSMDVCGIPPYDATHLGHAFTYLTFDLVVRRLEDLGHEVRMVRNVTDVDEDPYGDPGDFFHGTSERRGPVVGWVRYGTTPTEKRS